MPKRIVRGPNVLIMSAAGKPIFVRYGHKDRTILVDSDKQEGYVEEDDWATACSLIQAIRANVMSFSHDSENYVAPLGDIQSVRAGRKIIVFMNTEAMTLVAIGDDALDTEFIHLHLEYAYAQLIFTLTDQVNAIFQQSPNYDLRTMMGPNVNASLRNLLDRFDAIEMELDDHGDTSSHDQGSGCGAFLTAAVECINPISPELRDQASTLLINECRLKNDQIRNRHSEVHDPLFAILLIGAKLVTLVRPQNSSLHLHTSDLHLILTFVGLQPGLLTNELWFPICLPRFDSSGFLYAFTSCLDPYGTGLSIVLISSNNSTKQFEAFRMAAMNMKKSLGLPPTKSNILRIYDSSYSVQSPVVTPILGNRDSRVSESENEPVPTINRHSDDNDKGFDDTMWKRESTVDDISQEGPDEDDRRSRKRGGTSVGNHGQISTLRESPLIDALKIALSPEQRDEMMSRYLNLASAAHFVFRCEVFINSHHDDSPGTMLAQCFGPPIGFPFVDAASQRHVWNIYQHLSLRLRLGSASVETTMDAFDMIIDGHDNYSIGSRGISRDCPMQCLLESSPCVHGVTYVQENNEWLYVGVNGRFFELYATFPGIISPKTGAAYCARLVRKLMGDEKILFLTNPLTWRS